MALHHGGKLLQAVERYQIPKSDWLDLSTGINPYSYWQGNQVSEIPNDVWQRLPEEGDGLEYAIAHYYGINYQANCLPIPGSQWAIQQLPLLRRIVNAHDSPREKVLLPALGYQEHHHAWQKAGFLCEHYHEQPTSAQLESCSVLVVINPNNPAGWRIDQKTLSAWQEKLAERKSWLVIDEAFIDAEPEQSVLPWLRDESHCFENVIVLRSLGKFFGLAGLRMGVVFSQREIISGLKEVLGPWAIPGPTRWVAKQALQDQSWQRGMRRKLPSMANKLSSMLEDIFQAPVVGSSLFKTVFLENAEMLHHRLCQRGVLVRLLDDKSGLRFGLPEDIEENWLRLDCALRESVEAG
ncbi:MAG: threonine-phosphate decarboxylase CobD [Cellvibrionaceae bacterium]